MFRVLISVFLVLVSASSLAAQDRYRIQPGDVLQIEVLEDSTLNRNALVLPDGTFSFPLAGTIQAGGQSVTSVQKSLTQALAPNFAASPNVLVAVNQLANVGGVPAPKTIDVYIMGEVTNPGKVSVNTGTNLLQFLAEAGGFTPYAATKRILLRRNSGGKSMVYKFNYRAVETGSAPVDTIVLRAGDVVVVPERRLFE